MFGWPRICFQETHLKFFFPVDCTCSSSFNEFSQVIKTLSASEILLSAIKCVLCITAKNFYSRNHYLFSLNLNQVMLILFVYLFYLSQSVFISLHLLCHCIYLPASLYTTCYLDLSPRYFAWELLRSVFWHTVKTGFLYKLFAFPCYNYFLWDPLSLDSKYVSLVAELDKRETGWLFIYCWSWKNVHLTF